MNPEEILKLCQKIALQLTQNPQLSEDLAQESALRAMEGLGLVETNQKPLNFSTSRATPNNLEGWLRQIVKHQLIDLLRRERERNAREKSLEELSREEFSKVAQSPTLLVDLTPAEEEFIRLREEGRSLEEIAELWGTSRKGLVRLVRKSLEEKII